MLHLESHRRFAVGHAVLTSLLVVWNGLANSGAIFARNVGQVSRSYETPFTPAGYAFAIWLPIYVGLLAMAIFGLVRAFEGREPSRRRDWVRELGWPFALAQIVCGLWLVAWQTEHIVLSFFLMLLLWQLLMQCVLRLNMERWDAPWKIISLVWWPMSLYSGWITVALLANLSSMLDALGLAFVQTPAWTLGLAAVLLTFNIALVWTRNMREFSMVAVWALVAIALRHAPDGPQGVIRTASFAGAALLLVSSVAHAVLRFSLPPKEPPQTNS
jgi:hypothetical protein